MTDAGTPVVSDPGEGLVAAWAAAGGTRRADPGRVVGARGGRRQRRRGPRWSFEGFLPRSGRERRERLARIAADERGTVLFEAPGRLAATLRDLAAACGAERPGAVCRELTKLHEQIVRGSLGELAAMAADGTIPARGEVVIVVGWAAAAWTRPTPQAGLAAARARVEALVAAGSARGDAARQVSKETGIPRRALYDADGHKARAGSRTGGARASMRHRSPGPAPGTGAVRWAPAW